jgi:hypothetical protein
MGELYPRHAGRRPRDILFQLDRLMKPSVVDPRASTSGKDRAITQGLGICGRCDG